jgi:hypothetical protein
MPWVGLVRWVTKGYGRQDGTILTAGNVLTCDIAGEVLEKVGREGISGSHERLEAASIKYSFSSRMQQPAGIM